MTWHIVKIQNDSGASAVLTNPKPATNEGWKDNHLILPGLYEPKRSVMINQFTDRFLQGERIYGRVADTVLNIYTKVWGSLCFWDNGHDVLWGVKESDPINTIILYQGKGDVNLTITINPDGNLHFRMVRT
jgi:hypothetical protein